MSPPRHGGNFSNTLEIMKQPRSTDLQPWPLAMAAFRRVWEQRDDWLRLAVLPVAAAFGLNIWFQPYAEIFFGAMQPGQEPNFVQLASVQGPLFMFWAVNWLIIAIFSGNWMRALALGGSSVAGIGLNIGRQHVRMWLHLMLFQIVTMLAFFIGLFIVLLILPVAAVVFAASILFAIWMVVAVVRLIPLWMGIAIDAPMKLREAWQRTAGHGIKLAVAFVIVSLVLFFLQSMFLSLSFSLGVMEAAPLALSFISVVIQFIMFAAIGAVFVLAYPRFVSETV